MAAAILLPSLIYLLISIGLGYRAERHSLQQATLTRASEIIGDVDGRLREVSSTVRALATIRSIRERNWQEAAARSAEFAALDPDWRNVTLFDLADGRILMALKPDRDAPALPLLSDMARHSATPWFSGVTRGKGEHALFAYLRIDITGDRHYLLRVTLSPDLVQRILVARAPAEGISGVVDNSGYFIARTKGYPERIGTPGTLYLMGAIKKGRTGLYKGVTWEGLRNYTGFATSRQTGWSSHVAVSSTIIDTPQRWWRFTTFLAGLASIALGLIFSALAYRMWRTERRSEERMKQAERLEAIGKLTGGVAHDFNNMLAIVLGNLELAQRRLARGEDDISHHLDNAVAGAERAADLTRRLLAFSRRQALAPAAVDVNALLDTMHDMLNRTLSADIEVRFSLVGTPCVTFVDPGLLENAIINLAVNARDAMPAGGTLTISTAETEAIIEGKRGRYVRITVSDTGTGMTPEVVKRAIEPFFTTKEVGRGTGLGLSQIHGFVSQSGGFLDLASRPGAGTQVSLFLPCHQGEVAPPARGRAMADLPRGSASVLVVEDEEQVRLATVEGLRELGYTVRHAADGPAALRLIDEEPFAAMITDIVMPGMDGITLAALAAEKLPELAILYVTGNERDALTEALGNKLLRKPFSLEELAEHVGRVIEASRAE